MQSIIAHLLHLHALLGYIIEVIVVYRCLAVSGSTTHYHTIVIDHVQQYIFRHAPHFMIIEAARIAVVVMRIYLNKTDTFVIDRLAIGFLTVIRAWSLESGSVA